MRAAGLGIRSDWVDLEEAAVAQLQANPGVYELGSEAGETLLIAYAGGRSLFGLRGEVAKYIGHEKASRFRVEQNMQYISRWKELLMFFRSQHGRIPELNPETDLFGLGHLGPRTRSTEA